MDPSIPSSIKFGGFDPSGVLPGDELVYLKTADPTTWGLSGLYVVIFDHTIATTPEPKTCLVSPQLPYLYLPDFEF